MSGPAPTMRISCKSDQNCDLYRNFLYIYICISILTLRIRIRDLQNEKCEHPHLPHSPPSEVEGVGIVVISFGNIAQKKGTVVLKYMGRLLKNKKIKKRKKWNTNSTALFISSRQFSSANFQNSSPPPHYFDARDVSAENLKEVEEKL